MKRSFDLLAPGLALAAIAILALSFGASQQEAPAVAASLPGQTPGPRSYFPVVFNGPTPTVTPTPPPVTPPAAGDWLTFVNYYRASARLPALGVNPSWSQGAQEHACYMVRNDRPTYYQEPGLCTSPAGAEAGANSNLFASGNVNTSDKEAIDTWMAGPFHSLRIIDPALQTTGFGSHREAVDTWQMAAVLDILRGRTGQPPPAAYPVRWPGHNTTVYLKSYNDTEFPGIVQTCPPYIDELGIVHHYRGLPVVLQLGSGNVITEASVPVVTGASFRRDSDGLFLFRCVFDETSFHHGDPAAQTLGRAILAAQDAIVLVPLSPLTPGSYTVTITALGQAHVWTFHVAP
jgi:uncharacterized protein YkwD